MYNEMEYIYDEIDTLLAHEEDDSLQGDNLSGFSIGVESIYA